MADELSLDDVSAVIRLIREACDLWDDPRAWREHLLHGACRMLNGNVGMILAQHDSQHERGAFGRIMPIAIVGVSAAMQSLVAPAVAQLDYRPIDEVTRSLMPGMDTLQAEMDRQGWVTTSREQIVDAKTYHAAPYYQNVRRRMDCDDFVVSIRIVDAPRRVEAISIDRPHGAQPFRPRDVAILKLLHDEIAPLIGVRLATEAHLCRDGLSRRLRETLSLLLDGKSEKEAAAAMGLATRTVHDYVTMLYEHFKVASRGELLAYFIRRAPVLRP